MMLGYQLTKKGEEVVKGVIMEIKTKEEMKEMSLDEIQEYETWISTHALQAWHIRRYMEMD